MPSLDPTKTATLRQRYSQAMNRRFRLLATDVRKSIIDNDGFGFRTNQPAPRNAFNFPTSSQKVAAFQEWLRREIDRGILEVIFRSGTTVRSHREWQNHFIRSAYIRAVTDSEAQLSRAGQLVAPLDIAIGLEAGVHVETLELMFTRVFEGLRGITDSMAGDLSEVLTQALIDGVGPRVIAKRITDRIGSISRRRALVLARTEIIRAYSESTLNIFEQNGIEGVAADVEFHTAGDSRVCQRCLALEGNIYTLSEARGIIPVHPRCRCAWLAANIGESAEDVRARNQRKTKARARRRELEAA